ncbi:GlxA family transcriptional regulator [Roseovarius aestuarii]|uniref:HTH-type transcriptional regulator CdhR n=2 Tax=Roseovarius aestuarii TaxID=475083 RepID=A0A1X7BSU1_9RHOB|nr:GlxA family transcriptional regulator [Roseovarius aestuarii]SMC12682.1 HTH-type transcriptional regulator CdhR [Roseovarius aestuarii]
MTDASLIPARIVCVLLPRFNMMSLLSLLEPLRIANYLSTDPLYTHTYASAEGGGVPASNGMSVETDVLPEKLGRDDLVLVLGSWGAEHYANPKLTGWLRRQERAGLRLCAVEMASYVFARAGLLGGRRATTHWAYLPGFQELFPDVLAAEQLYTIDGRILTCAGSTAGLDLMQHLIRQDHGDALVAEIADNIVHHPIRPEAAPQRQAHGMGLERLPSSVRAAVDLMDANIPEPLTVPEIARQVGISQRQLERQFHRAMGCSVVQFGLILRLQHARVLLISTGLGVREIAAASGFNSLSHFAYAFRNCFGRRPSEYRQAWPDQNDTPSWPGTLSKYLETLQLNQRMRGKTSE